MRSDRMLARMCIAVALLVAVQGCRSSAVQGKDYYVSPSGNRKAAGTIDDPWDLSTALSHPSAVKASDTIWVRGGVYRGAFESLLKGERGRPITVRNYKGERAIIDSGTAAGTALIVHGSDCWYWGLEIMSSNPKRTTPQTGSEPTDLQRAAGVAVEGQRTKFINMVVHDTAGGYGFWTSAGDSEIYGNIIYYNGWAAPDRAHGHGVYAQNQTGQKLIHDNIAFSNFGMGLRAYGSENAAANNIDFTGNASFNAGILFRNPPLRWANFFVSVGSGSRDIVLDSNYAYHLPSDNQGGSSLGWTFSGEEKNVIARNNYWIGGGAAIELWNWNDVVFERNTIYSDQALGLVLNHLPSQKRNEYHWDKNTYHGSDLMRLNGRNVRWSQWKQTTGLDSNSTYQPGRPKGVWTFVRPNKYERGRAHVIIYNWDLLGEVAVDLAGALTKGAHFEVRDAQNLFADRPLISGIYQGGAVRVPMKGLAAGAPVGMQAPPHTAPEFAVFVVREAEESAPAGGRH